MRRHIPHSYCGLLVCLAPNIGYIQGPGIVRQAHHIPDNPPESPSPPLRARRSV